MSKDKRNKDRDSEHHGMWYTCATPDKARMYECSECGHTLTTMVKQCPNCKSKMKVRY